MHWQWYFHTNHRECQVQIFVWCKFSHLLWICRLLRRYKLKVWMSDVGGHLTACGTNLEWIFVFCYMTDNWPVSCKYKEQIEHISFVVRWRWKATKPKGCCSRPKNTMPEGSWQPGQCFSNFLMWRAGLTHKARSITIFVLMRIKNHKSFYFFQSEILHPQ